MTAALPPKVYSATRALGSTHYDHDTGLTVVFTPAAEADIVYRKFRADYKSRSSRPYHVGKRKFATLSAALRHWQILTE